MQTAWHHLLLKLGLMARSGPEGQQLRECWQRMGGCPGQRGCMLPGLLSLMGKRSQLRPWPQLLVECMSCLVLLP